MSGKLLDKTIKTAQGEKIKTKNVITVLPEQKTFIKLIEVSTVDDDQLDEAIREEVVNHIPLNIDEVFWDWQIIKKDSDTTKLLIGAAPKGIVNSYTSFLEKSNLIPNALEIEAAAIIRSLINFPIS